jgi:hypothetical protein
MWRALAIIAVAFLLEGPLPAASLNQNLFSNFVAMKLPQREVPVGAKWLPGIGPTGPGADTDNLVTSQSVTNDVITSTLKRQLAFSVGTFLGLDANRSQTLDATFANLSVVRVSDLTKIRTVRAGDQLLYLAIKAGKISIKTDTGSAASLKAGAERKDVPVTLTASGGNTSVITLDGSDLFIAYQVLQLGKPQVRQTIVPHKGGEAILLGKYRFRFCQCAPGNPVTVEWGNLSDVGTDGVIVTKRITFHPVTERLNEYPLDSDFAGNTITAARVRFLYRATQECTPMGGVSTPAGVPTRLCGPIQFPKADNKIVLTTTSFVLSPVARPDGPF